LPALRTLAARPTRQRHHVRSQLGVALAALALAASDALAFARPLELGYQPCLLVFGEGASDLPHHHAERVAAVRQIIAVGGEHAHAALDERDDAQLLRHQLTSSQCSRLRRPCSFGLKAFPQEHAKSRI
jgi:hypothetical protein